MGCSMDDLAIARSVARDIRESGGNAYFVGGYVRDKLIGKENKDIDVEVFGITPFRLKEILSKYGYIDEVGASFGVLMIRGVNIDFTMPRTERKIGEGHKSFDISVNPNLSLKEASKRRDFTINSIMQDIISEEIIDLWGGKRDLETKTIRHINNKSFIEDPLRVLRACQFASRFNFNIDINTIELCKSINISTLPKERIFEELRKALLKSDKPSIFFEYMYNMNQLDHFFKEVKDLKGVVQSPKYHKEGDVWNHTMMVLNECAKLRDLSSNPIGYMLLGLCHDLGKSTCTKIKDNGKITSIMHDIEGANISKRLLSRITNDKHIIKYVCNMVPLHMKPNQYANDKSSFKATRKLFSKSINPKDLILFAKADHLGRLESGSYDEYENWLYDRLEDFNTTCSEPLINGKDLIKMGYRPSSEFKYILDKAYNLQMGGLSKENIIKQLKL